MSTNEVTSELLDRLVDGELAPSERRELLLRLEESPDGWRRCAMAFLESQAWGREFQTVVAKPQTSSARVNSSSDRPLQRIISWAALAASLFGAFWLGGKADWGKFSTSTPIASSFPVHQPTEPPNPNDVMTMWVHDVNGVAQPLHVPLVDADVVDKQLGSQFKSSVSPEMAQKLKDRGYEVESRQRYAPLWLEQGQPLMVPVEDTRIVPVSREVL